MLHLSLSLVSGLFVSGFALQAAPAQNAANTAPPPADTAPRPTLSAQERGDIQMARKMYREAIETYRQAPETAPLMNKIGIAYHQLTDLTNAQKAYERAVKLDPNFTAAINN